MGTRDAEKVIFWWEIATRDAQKLIFRKEIATRDAQELIFSRESGLQGPQPILQVQRALGAELWAPGLGYYPCLDVHQGCPAI